MIKFGNFESMFAIGGPKLARSGVGKRLTEHNIGVFF